MGESYVLIFIFLFVLFILIPIAIARWVFRVNHIVSRLDIIIQLLKVKTDAEEQPNKNNDMEKIKDTNENYQSTLAYKAGKAWSKMTKKKRL